MVTSVCIICGERTHRLHKYQPEWFNLIQALIIDTTKHEALEFDLGKKYVCCLHFDDQHPAKMFPKHSIHIRTE